MSRLQRISFHVFLVDPKFKHQPRTKSKNEQAPPHIKEDVRSRMFGKASTQSKGTQSVPSAGRNIQKPKDEFFRLFGIPRK